MIQKLVPIIAQLQDVNQKYDQLFADKKFKHDKLSKKYYTSQFTKLYQLFQTGPIEQTNKYKQQLLLMYTKFMQSMLKNNIILRLSKVHEEDDFLDVLSQQWENFKRFTFFYFALLQNANQYYQQAHKVVQNQRQQFYEKFHQQAFYIYPVPVIALKLFRCMILENNRERIHHVILVQFQKQRDNKLTDKEKLRNMFEIIWSCGLGQLARIRSKNNIITFYKEDRVQQTKHFKHLNIEEFFKNYILIHLISEALKYYNELYQTKIRNLNPIEDIVSVTKYLQNEQNISNYYFFTNTQKQLYLNSISKIMVERDINDRIQRENGIKMLLDRYKYDSNENFQQIKKFFKLLTFNKQSTINVMQQLIKNTIFESAQRIQKKIKKPKQYITDMICLKKSINKILQETNSKDYRLSLVRDQSFKKQLDTLEAAKNLGQYTDFTIKQCIKLRLSEQQILQKFQNIFLILQSLVAQDSLLIYHQQYLGKRLLNSLNQPKLEIQIFFLKKISEKIGMVSINNHMSMIKDIQHSIDMTQRYANKMPFTSFNWNIKLFTSAFWPDSFLKNKIQIIPPNILFKQLSTIQVMYKEDFQHKFLSWRLDKGLSLFSGKFKQVKFRFQGQNIYLMILLHIQQSHKHSILYGNLKSKIKSHLLQKYVMVLIQSNLLTRQYPHSALNEGQTISINMNYKPKVETKPNQIITIRPSLEMHKLFHQNNLQTNKIMKERQKLIEAALVKVLKHSNSSGNNCITFIELYNSIKTHKVLKSFNFSENIVKERLQQLLALGYCERDEQDRKIYHYIA